MNIKSIYIKISICTVMILGLTVTGCKKFVQVPDPIDSIPSDLVFDTDAKADAAVRSLYATMVSGANVAFGGAVQISMGLSADELVCPSTSTTFYDFYTAGETSANAADLTYLWGPLYNIIYSANSVISGATASTGMTDAGKKQYIAEARFIRAACYFYLINLYGDVPLVTTTDYVANSNIARTPVNQVYAQITSDLLFAQANLAPTYLGTQRLTANRYSASALLARVYLYNQDYVDAEAAASDVIDGAGSTVYAPEPDLTKTFLLTSKEVILQIQQPATNLYTWDGFLFVPGTAATTPIYTINDALYNSFETGDLRKANWIKTVSIVTAGVSKTYNYPYKYKLNTGTGTTRTESMVFLRLSEVYLIRSEARAQQNKLSTAITDIDVIRKRSGLTLIGTTNPGISQANLLTAIAHERYVELFVELGHRWMDLKRTGLADAVLANKLYWRPQSKLFPIPVNEVTYNPSMVQNPGY